MQRLSACVAVGLLALAGCGTSDSDVRLVPVGGTVRLDGKPLANARLTFKPTGTTRGSVADGQTDAEGKYQLRSRQGGTGAAVGSYQVIISKIALLDGSAPDPSRPPAVSGAREVLPQRYSSPRDTILTATVSEEGTPVDIDLTSRK